MPHPLLALQQSAGNQAVVRHLARFRNPEEEDVEPVMERLATGRHPLFISMQLAPDEEERRRRTLALRHFDAPWLAKLRALGTSKAHPNPTVQDMVLAAIQLEAVATAEGALRSPEDAHETACNEVEMRRDLNWCGFFAVEKFLQSDLDRELKSGYFHVKNVHDYFRYRYAFGPQARVKKWIHAEDQWHALDEYHAQRGSKRQWLTNEDLQSGDALDIRAGDVALLDHEADGRPNHIVMVHSYDPQTRHLRTIGGNDRGYQVDHRAERGPVNDEIAELEDASGLPLRKRQAGTPKVGMRLPDLVNVFGVGRPSIVDFEEHRYDSASRKGPPATV